MLVCLWNWFVFLSQLRNEEKWKFKISVYENSRWIDKPAMVLSSRIKWKILSLRRVRNRMFTSALACEKLLYFFEFVFFVTFTKYPSTKENGSAKSKMASLASSVTNKYTGWDWKAWKEHDGVNTLITSAREIIILFVGWVTIQSYLVDKECTHSPLATSYSCIHPSFLHLLNIAPPVPIPQVHWLALGR